MEDIKWERRDEVGENGIHPSAPRNHTKLIRYMYRCHIAYIIITETIVLGLL